VRQLLPRLRDPLFTMVLLVTLPEATPIHEAMQLERDLARADITPPTSWRSPPRTREVPRDTHRRFYKDG
jgi:hypothetical protein